MLITSCCLSDFRHLCHCSPNMTSTYVKMIHSLYEDGGVGSPSNPVKFKGQDYKQLKKSLLNEGSIFKDDTFPANLNSLGKLVTDVVTAEQLSEVEWLRAHVSQHIYCLKL